MRSFLLIILLFLNVFASQAQKDSVRLVDIRSSECGGTYLSEPHFLKKETIGDTTYISLSGSNNCFGYHNPTVSLSGDSVLITFPPGAKRIIYEIKNKCKYKYINESELDELGFANYRDSLHLKQETILTAECDCCFTFDLKIIGINPSKSYKCFYNNVFINPNYVRKEPEIIELR